MKRLMVLFLGLCVLGAASTSSPAASYTDYFLYQQWGGTWQDVNKSPANPDDDLMCWAATASNVLSWGHWGTPAYNSTGNIFQHILDHWTDNAGYTNWAWRWWFNGAPPPYSTYSHIDVPGGGNFYPYLNFLGYSRASASGNLMATVDSWMHQGYGVGLVIRKGMAAHAITAWGFKYEMLSGNIQYKNIFVTDSDDGATALKNYPLIWQNNAWYLGGSYAGWRISSLEALKYQPLPLTGPPLATPITPTWLLLGTGLLALGAHSYRRAKASNHVEGG